MTTLRIAALVLFLLRVLLVTASPSDAWARGGGHGHGGGHHGHHGRHFHHFHGGVFAGVGPWWWWDPYWYWYYPPPYYFYPPPPVIVNEPPVYIEQSPPGYWYYCPSAKGYYPSVPSCPESWVRVAPRSQSGGIAGAMRRQGYDPSLTSDQQGSLATFLHRAERRSCLRVRRA